LAKWRRLFTAYHIPCYVIFDNDGTADDEKGTKRRDALQAVGISEPDHQDSYLEFSEMLVHREVAGVWIEFRGGVAEDVSVVLGC